MNITLVQSDPTSNSLTQEGTPFAVSFTLAGSPGLSAYQQWLTEGNTGTWDDFYESLRGGVTEEVQDLHDEAVAAAGRASKSETNAAGSEAAAVQAASGASASASNARISESNALDYRNAAQAWAEGTEPGGVGTKSSKGWADDSSASAAAAENYSILAADNSRLSIGTVTTGPEGTEASATIAGEPGSQTLSVTIPRGNTGEIGPDGISAYEVALGSGFVGTEAEWLASLVGEQGEQGVGIESIVRTAGDGSPGTTDTYTITYTDATTSTFTVYNGADGDGAGDMLKSTYDTNGSGVVDNAELVNGLSVETAVPLNAVFTDTTYTNVSEFTNDAGYLTSETVTSLSLANNILTYIDENGISHNIDLSLYLDDTNLARLTSGTLDGATGIATFTRDDETTFTVDFSALLDDTQVTVEDNLTSSSADSALSANQGRILSESIPSSIDNLIDVDTSTATPATGDALIWNGSAWVPGGVASDVAAILTPEITSPLNGATGVLLTPTIQFSPYYSLYGKPQQALQVQISTVSDFATTVVDETVGAVSEYTPSSNLDTITQHYSRGRYQDDEGVWSAWTPVVGFTTADIYIEQPTITSPTSGATDIGETPTFTTDAFNCINGTDTHAETSWYLYRTSDEVLVWSSVGDTSNLESITLPAGVHDTSEGYRLEAVHTGTTYGDSTKGAVTYTTAASFFDWGPGDDYDAMVAAGNYDDTTDTGYMGFVTSADLTDGLTLATDIGLSAGTAFNNDAGWLKFYVGPAADCNKDGVAKVLFIAKKTIRNNLSWDDIYLAGAVYGTGDNGTASASTGTTAMQDAQVTYGSTTYKVRLLTGSATDPAAEAYNNQSCADDAGGGSEWNDLLYRVHTAVPTCTDATIGMEGGSETTRHGGPQDGDNWASYTNAELQVHSSAAGDGTYCWCQEQGNNTSRRVYRGTYGVADFYTNTAADTNADYGFRPCLEVVQA